MPLRPVECSPGCPCCVSRPRPPSCRPPSSQLCPEPLDAERGGEHSRRGQGGDGPHVVPGGPLRDVLGPAARCAGVLGVQHREPVVERDVARDRYPDGANEVERAAGDHQRRRPFAGGDHGQSYQPETSHGRPEQCRHESGGDGQLVDRLHRGDAVRCRQPLQRGHHERREGEEDPRVQAASEGGRQRRGVENPIHRPPSQMPVAAASRASSRSATRRPVLLVPPRTSVVPFCCAFSVSIPSSPSTSFTRCKLTWCKVTLYFTSCQVANYKPGRKSSRRRGGCWRSAAGATSACATSPMLPASRGRRYTTTSVRGRSCW